MHDKRRFLRDYILFSDEILTAAEAKQKRIQVLVCLLLTSGRKKIFASNSARLQFLRKNRKRISLDRTLF